MVIFLGIQILLLIIRYRPDVVITTGAAPGYFAVVFGHIIGSKTIWIDSIANADTLSLSGRKMARWAGLWLTQWPDLAKPDGPQYKGSVF
jgi:UDP-N-acetylglucosamine:LPS N-acetylglucosamine transferase